MKKGSHRGNSSAEMDWAWKDDPILLPLAFESREWNAVYIALYLAECSGSTLIVVHVGSEADKREKIERFIQELRAMSYQVGVRLQIEEVPQAKSFPTHREIWETILWRAETNNVQAIVMSAHREPFFTELFGRISDHVARRADRTTLLVETPRKGMLIPNRPKRILIPVLREPVDSEPFRIAAMLTSSASAANVEIVAVRFVSLPHTVPLDAVQASETLRRVEKRFSQSVASYLGSLGRLFVPKILPVRSLGPEAAEYATEVDADLLILSSRGPSGFRGLLRAEEYDLVSRASCISLVVFPKKGH